MASWSNTFGDQILSSAEPILRDEGMYHPLDRRGRKRFGFFRTVLLETLNGKQVAGYSQDASAAGLRMKTHEQPFFTQSRMLTDIHSGEQGYLSFIDDGGTIRFTCTVVRVSKEEIALVIGEGF